VTNSKDTIKKEKTNLLPQTLINDTIFDPNVKYVVYKKMVMLLIMPTSFMEEELQVDSDLICIK